MPEQLSASFHGRDLFAPVAGRIAGGELGTERLQKKPRLDVELGAGDLGEVIYIDHYGNAFTGLRAGSVPHGAHLAIRRARRGASASISAIPFAYDEK